MLGCAPVRRQHCGGRCNDNVSGGVGWCSHVELSRGWVRLPIFDFNKQLQRDTMTVKMWPDAPPAYATSVANHGNINAARLTLRFGRAKQRVRWRPAVAESESSRIEFGLLSSELRNMLEVVVARNNAGVPLSDADMRAVWQWRHAMSSRPDSLALVLRSAPIDSSCNTIREVHALLNIWPPLDQPLLAVELLGAAFVDRVTRQWAVKQLERIDDDDVLMSVLMALVQALKCEMFHNNALTRFLLGRAVRSSRVGQRLYWLLNTKIARDVTHATRFGLILEAYLRAGDTARSSIMRQRELVNALHDAVTAAARDAHAVDIELRTVARKLSAGAIECPLDCRFKLRSLLVDRCKFTNAKRTALLLVFGCDQARDGTRTLLFKTGDDMRRDVLALDAMRWMSAIWRHESLDLSLTTYECMPTSSSSALCEVLQSAASLATITASRRGNRRTNSTPLLDWLTDSAIQTRVSIADVLDRFTRSCAALCVANYVLGITDRHDELTAVRATGELFAIELAHMFGNARVRTASPSQRDPPTPFVMSHDVKRVIAGNNNNDAPQAAAWNAFVSLGASAISALRRHSQQLLALLAALLPAGVCTASDVEFVAVALTSRDDAWLSTTTYASSPSRLSFNEKLHTVLRLRSPFTVPAALEEQSELSRHYGDRATASASLTAALSTSAAPAHRVYSAQNALELVRSHAESRDRHVPLDVVVNDPNERPAAIVALLTALTNQYAVSVDQLSVVDLKQW
jgi:phosphatidylinositol-4,5-bisphosphate 3-kinase